MSVKRYSIGGHESEPWVEESDRGPWMYHHDWLEQERFLQQRIEALEAERDEAERALAAIKDEYPKLRSKVARLEAEVAESRAEVGACRELVAVCNRDGGKLQIEVGMEQAARLALRYVDDLRDLVARRVPDPDDLRVLCDLAEYAVREIDFTGNPSAPSLRERMRAAAANVRATLPTTNGGE